MNHRKTFIEYFVNQIQPLDYLLLKFTEGKLENIGEYSDLDFFIDKKTIPFIFAVIKNFDQVVKIEELHLDSMSQFFIHFQDGSFLQIDCLFRLVRKPLIYLANDYIKKNARILNGVKTYSNVCLFEHLVLFHQLNNDGLPQKYINYFKALPKLELLEIISFFKQKYKFPINSIADLERHDLLLKNALVKYLNNQSFNAILHQQINTFKYIKDTFTKLRRGRGRVVTFSGVDGAGKSTILDETRQMLEEKFRKKVVVLRHRPSLLPILSSITHGKKGAEQRAAANLPRQGKNQSQFSSIIRFAYYFIDYFFGQWYIYFRYQIQNYIVLYDRYYFDFIVDPKRSNIQLNEKLTRFLYRFIHKPNLNFFLYAPLHIILKRQQELSERDIHSLTSSYQRLFNNLSDHYDQKYFPIKNINKKQTLQFIQKELKNIL